MSFKEFIEHHFGTQKQFAEFLGVNRITAGERIKHPTNLTIRDVGRMSKSTGVDQCDIITIILTPNEIPAAKQSD